ncbi:MAG TPA: hypothetical protein VFD27_14855 [Chthoniobacteraceae bacterium]|jgi:hypothetical protein|nr:hypothetical protein [Chthoniobacteraceae bacterium]
MIPPASEPLCANGVRLGAIAMTPWDTEIFGFPVAQMTIESDLDVVAAAPEFAATLKAFADARDIALVATRIPVSKPAVVATLCGIGFQVVDHAIEARLPRLQRCKLPTSRGDLRAATAKDLAEIERIAASAFQFGRYHTDGKFPRALADWRYQWWVRRAFETQSETNILFVLEMNTRVTGFFHVSVKDTLAELQLGAIDIAKEHGLLGHRLYTATITELQTRGLREVTAQSSATNTGVLNLYAELGFRFAHPEVILHWHAKRISNETASAADRTL